jgi:hypothetical protein
VAIARVIRTLGRHRLLPRMPLELGSFSVSIEDDRYFGMYNVVPDVLVVVEIMLRSVK